MTMHTLWRRLMLGSVMVGLGVLCAAMFFQMRISRAVKAIPKPVQPAAQAVVAACFWSDITGDYWENEMLRQSKAVSAFPLPQRLAFYRTVLQSCDLANYRAIYFAEVVGDDAGALFQNLLDFRNASVFQDLPVEQRRNIENWIGELPVIVRQREHERDQKEK